MTSLVQDLAKGARGQWREGESYLNSGSNVG